MESGAIAISTFDVRMTINHTRIQLAFDDDVNFPIIFHVIKIAALGCVIS